MAKEMDAITHRITALPPPSWKIPIPKCNAISLRTAPGRAVAKLRSGNHNLRIESGRHCVPKLPEYLRICQHCRSNQIENENHFLFHCDR